MIGTASAGSCMPHPARTILSTMSEDRRETDSMKPPPNVLRFQPSLWAAVLHLLMFAAVFTLFIGRKPGMFRSETLLDLVPGFYGHVSNFAIFWLLLAGVGFLWLMMGVRMAHVALAALALIVANLVYEFFLPVLNTRDPIDALYGVVGTLLAFAWLWLIHRFGLKPLPVAEG